MDQPGNNVRRCVATERHLPGEHFVQRHAQGKEIAAPIHLPPPSLLGRHVFERAHDDPGCRFDEHLGWGV